MNSLELIGGMIDDPEVEFSEGFTDLHTVVYQNILNGNGFRISDARASVELAYKIRHAQPTGIKGYLHPLVGKNLG